jgi:hypothetical protein
VALACQCHKFSPGDCLPKHGLLDPILLSCQEKSSLYQLKLDSKLLKLEYKRLELNVIDYNKRPEWSERRKVRNMKISKEK